MKKFTLVFMLLCIVPVLGCKVLVSPIEPLVPQAPAAAATPPEISNLVLSPSQIQAGIANPVSVSFDYEDLNADVDSGTADIEVTVSVFSGSFSVDSTPQLAPGMVEQDQTHWGRKGRVKLTRLINLPQDADGVISVRFVLIDAAGQRSNALTGELRIMPAETNQGGGIGPGGERCTVLDGDRNPVTLVRIGRQVLFRVEDEDNNFSSDRQDRLFRVAALQASSSGDVEVINWMLETGTNTGVFEGPAAGILLTSRFPVINNGELSVLDNDTIIAHYEDPNSPGDMCIAIAKVL
jgi:hypothetical protein